MGGVKGWEFKIYKRIGMLYVLFIWDKINIFLNNNEVYILYLWYSWVVF